MKSAKKSELPDSLVFFIGNQLVRNLTETTEELTTPSLVKPPDSEIATSDPGSAVISSDSKKHFFSTHLLFALASFSLFITLVVIGGVLFHEHAQAEQASKKISSIKFDTFVTQNAQAYLASANQDQSISTRLNQITNQKISVTDGSTVTNVSPATIKGWLNLTVNKTLNKASITVNQPAIQSYFNNLVSSQTHPASAQVTVTHPDGSTETLFPGIDGQAVSGAQQAANRVDQSLLNATGMSEVLPTLESAYTTTSTIPVSKLIEVDLTKKVMYIYQDNSTINTFPVSAGAPDTPTPIGTFHIYEKLTSQNMTGYNVNGTKYFQPNVPWVNYFDGADAIHGNYWRPLSWFGNINSSHGCVGVDVSNGEWIYNWAPIGTTVITHL